MKGPGPGDPAPGSLGELEEGVQPQVGPSVSEILNCPTSVCTINLVFAHRLIVMFK